MSFPGVIMCGNHLEAVHSFDSSQQKRINSSSRHFIEKRVVVCLSRFDKLFAKNAGIFSFDLDEVWKRGIIL
jgi:hypothetical protein